MAGVGEMSRLIAITFVSGILASFAGTTAFAQAGSTGGTLGKTNKGAGPSDTSVENSSQAVPLDLSGIWISSDYTCPDRKGFLTERVNIDQVDSSLTATKITGDNCVHAGDTTWLGTLPTPLPMNNVGTVSFPVQVRVSHGPNTKTFFVNGKGVLQNDEVAPRIVIITTSFKMTMTRATR